MPTYRVTDPTTGRTVKLTGDSPPTEQELEDVFKSLGPAAGAAPVAAPAPSASAAPKAPWEMGDLERLIVGLPPKPGIVAYNGVLSSVVPKERQLQAASAIAGSQQAPLNPEVSRLPLLGPILDLARAVRHAGPDVARGLVNNPVETIRGGAAGAAEGLMELASPLNMALQAFPYARNLLKSKPVVPPSGPGAPRLVKTKVPSTPEARLAQTLDDVRTTPPPPAPSVELPPEPTLTRAGRPATTLGVETPRTARPYDVTPGPRSATNPVARAWSPELAAADDAVESVGQAATKQVDELLKSGAPPAAAAEALEQSVPAVVEEAVTKIKLSAPELVRQMRDRFGSARAGDMLFGNTAKAGPGVLPRPDRVAAVKRMAPGPSKVPEIVKDYKHGVMAQREAGGIEAQLRASLAERLGGESGAVNPRLLGQIGSTVAGAAAGATQGEDTEDRIVNGLIGAGIGAAAVPVISHLAVSGLRVPKGAQNAMYGSILSSPTSVAKAYLGAFGGTIAAATEKIAAGDSAAGARIIRTMLSPQSVSTFVTALRNPAATGGMAADAPNLVGRVFGAGDAVARRAMAAGGIGAEEASRFTLSGMPTTKMGQDLLGVMNRYFELRLITSLFPRVGMQIVERGLERSPAGLLNIPGLNEGASQGLKVARAGLGTAAGVAGYAFSDSIPDWAKPYVAAVSGVYALPLGIGLAAGTAADLGKDGEDQLTAGLSAFAGNLPFPQYGPTEGIKQFLSGSSFIPSGLRDAAVAMDPYERDTSGSMFDRAKAKIPGLREELPVKGRRVNVAGEPITDRSTPFQRVFNPAPTKNAPFAGIPDDVAAEVRRLGVQLNSPSFEKKAKIGSREVDVPPDAAERLQRERRQFLVPAIQKLLSSPSYQAASDAVKKRRLDAVINQAEERGSAKARATLAQILKGAPNAATKR